MTAKYWNNNNLNLYIEFKGRAAYFLRKLAKLRRNRVHPKEHKANYYLFSIEINALENLIRNREKTRSRVHYSKVKMQEEEKKESPRRGNLGSLSLTWFESNSKRIWQLLCLNNFLQNLFKCLSK